MIDWLRNPPKVYTRRNGIEIKNFPIRVGVIDINLSPFLLFFVCKIEFCISFIKSKLDNVSYKKFIQQFVSKQTAVKTDWGLCFAKSKHTDLAV